MTDQSEHSLIAKLEAASEGSRELDEEITAVISNAVLERQAGGRTAYHRETHWISVGEIKSYTTSIDAALTLLPRGRTFWHLSQYYDTGQPHAAECDFSSYKDDAGEPFVSKGSAATPALAICIAALRA